MLIISPTSLKYDYPTSSAQKKRWGIISCFMMRRIITSKKDITCYVFKFWNLWLSSEGCKLLGGNIIEDDADDSGLENVVNLTELFRIRFGRSTQSLFCFQCPSHCRYFENQSIKWVQFVEMRVIRTFN